MKLLNLLASPVPLEIFRDFPASKEKDKALRDEVGFLNNQRSISMIYLG